MQALRRLLDCSAALLERGLWVEGDAQLDTELARPRKERKGGAPDQVEHWIKHP